MIKKIIFFSSISLLISCSNNSTDQDKVADNLVDTTKKGTAAQPQNELADFKFHALVINIPSPFEIITLLPESGVPFKQELVNSTNNSTKYNTTTQKGLNYGAYIVDLIYLSSNEHFSEVKNYFVTSRGLAQNLGFVETFDHIIGPRMEKNIDKKDTIIKIIDQIYVEMDSYLRSNDRLLAATQILVGSWIESQYITANVIKDQTKNKKNEILFQKILKQNFASQKLVELLKEYEKEKDFKPIIDGVTELNKLYSDLHGDDIDAATLQKLCSKLNEVRGKFVN